MGQLLSIYESENKGLMPLGEFDRVATPDNNVTQWFWMFTLGNQINPNLLSSATAAVNPSTIQNLSKIFADTDTIQGHDYTWVSHYTCNPRLFYYPGEYNSGGPYGPTDYSKVTYDRFGMSLFNARKASSVQHSSSVFAIWDGPQAFDENYNTYAVAQAIDGFAFYNGYSGLYFDLPGSTVAPSLPIWPNSLDDGYGSSDGGAAQKQYNFDVPSAFNTAPGNFLGLRFRHMNNMTMNALCLDGHVENRNAGQVLRKDIYTNQP